MRARVLAPAGPAFGALAVLLAVCVALALLPKPSYAAAIATPAHTALTADPIADMDDAGALEGAPARSCGSASSLCWTLPARPLPAAAGGPREHPAPLRAGASRHKWLPGPPDQPPRAVA